MTEYPITMSSKGQLTLPAEVRRRLQLDKGDKLRFIMHDDGTLELKKPVYSSIDDVVGSAGRLEEPHPWHEVREIAREDHVAALVRRKRLR